MVLHTFRRDLKWNPHIHYLISEGGYIDDAYWCNVKHFNYSFWNCIIGTSVFLLKKSTSPSRMVFRSGFRITAPQLLQIISSYFHVLISIM